MEKVGCKRMSQKQQAAPPPTISKHANISRIARTVFFVATLLAVIATGVLAIITGATSTSTIWSGAFTVIMGIVTAISLYPILFPSSSSQPSSTNSTSSPAIANDPRVHNGGSRHADVTQPIFYFNLPLRDPREYYGRALARETLISRTANGGSSSIVGERRVGKTWLLEYLQLVAPTHQMLGSAYRIVYLSATHPQNKSVAAFAQHALELLKVPQHSIDDHQSPLSQLSQGVRDLKQLGVVPVLCIDEFEGFDNKQEFNSDFVEGLRALAQDDGLVLITASKCPLREFIEGLTGQTSPLFNIIQQISLNPFNSQEAHEFVNAKSRQASFGEKERNYFFQWSALYSTDGKQYWPPLRLQLVGQMLFDEKQEPQGSISDDQPDDVSYWSNFKQRLEDAYQAVVRYTK